MAPFFKPSGESICGLCQTAFNKQVYLFLSEGKRDATLPLRLLTQFAARAHGAELEGFAAVMEAIRNAAPGLKSRAIAGPHDYEQIPELAERGKLRVKNFFADFDARLGEVPFVAGQRFSVADITALVTVDFAAKAIGFSVPDEHRSLKRWYESVSSRSSMAA
jgi:glutathione S-transferase